MYDKLLFYIAAGMLGFSLTISGMVAAVGWGFAMIQLLRIIKKT